MDDLGVPPFRETSIYGWVWLFHAILGSADAPFIFWVLSLFGQTQTGEEFDLCFVHQHDRRIRVVQQTARITNYIHIFRCWRKRNYHVSSHKINSIIRIGVKTIDIHWQDSLAEQSHNPPIVFLLFYYRTRFSEHLGWSLQKKWIRPIALSQMLHVWNIYLQNWVILGVNVGKYSIIFHTWSIWAIDLQICFLIFSISADVIRIMKRNTIHDNPWDDSS